MRAAVFHLGPDEHALAFVIHHIVTDFWSLAVMFDELGRLYMGETGGEAELPSAPELTYGDWIRWQNERLAGPEGERLWLYWHEELRGMQPVLDLPADQPRPAVQTYRGASVALRFGPDFVAGLRGLAAASGATLYMTLLAGFQVVLHRWSGQEDLTVGSVVAGRGMPGIARVVGYFVNPVAVRGDLSGAPSFAAFLGRVRRAVLGALDHAGYPFALLTERLQPARDSSRSPLFQVLFILQSAHRPEQQALAALALGEGGAEVALGPLALTSIALPEKPAQLDLTLSLAETGEGLAASLGYNADLFDGTTAARLLGHLRELLVGAVAAPGTALGDLPLLTAEEQVQLLGEWNATAGGYPAERTIDQLIATQAEQTPDRTAVVADDRSLTYGELEHRARQLARHLKTMGVTSEVPVGVFTDRSSDMVVSLLAVLKAGGAYVPLDPSYPPDRVSYMLADSEAPVVLTHERFRSALAGWPGRTVCLDTDWPEIAGAGEAPAGSLAAPDQLAYLIYTSGSSRPSQGRPGPPSRGGQLPGRHGAPSGDRAGGHPPLGHHALLRHRGAGDLSALDDRGASGSGEPRDRRGGRCAPARPAQLRRHADAGHPGHLEDAACLRVGWPVAAARAVRRRSAATRPGGSAPGAGRHGLEPLRSHRDHDLVGRRSGAPGRARRPGALSIGRPIANTSIHIVDRGFRPVPVAVPGELLIGGHGLARGYRSRPDLTAEQFVPDPWSGQLGARLYRTGDLARFRPTERSSSSGGSTARSRSAVSGSSSARWRRRWWPIRTCGRRW